MDDVRIAVQHQRKLENADTAAVGKGTRKGFGRVGRCAPIVSVKVDSRQFIRPMAVAKEQLTTFCDHVERMTRCSGIRQITLGAAPLATASKPIWKKPADTTHVKISSSGKSS